MGLFENIVSNAKQAANVVGKKTGELVDTSKLKLQAVDLNSDIKRNYEALGRAVYESRKQGIDSTEEIDDIIILINEKYDELDEVRATVQNEQQNLLHKMRRTKSKNCRFMQPVRRKIGARSTSG
ncbi:MAG: hypothetical protein ACLR13_00610 [Acutalibacteraceae bacterium]